MSSYSLGRAGEDAAVKYLKNLGWTIIARNARSRVGEVDIVALDKETLVFLEVKAWSAYGLEELGQALDERKQKRIIETAKFFLSVNREYIDAPLRFDCLFIGPDGPRHLVSAFTERI